MATCVKQARSQTAIFLGCMRKVSDQCFLSYDDLKKKAYQYGKPPFSTSFEVISKKRSLCRKTTTKLPKFERTSQYGRLASNIMQHFFFPYQNSSVQLKTGQLPPSPAPPWLRAWCKGIVFTTLIA